MDYIIKRLYLKVKIEPLDFYIETMITILLGHSNLTIIKLIALSFKIKVKLLKQ